MLTSEITEMMFNVSKNYGKIRNKLSEQFIIGIGHRYSMMADAYVEIAQVFLRDPNSEQEQNYFNIYLNSLYINIFGTIENLAWLIYYEKIYPDKKPNKYSISIFKEKFIKICFNCGLDIANIKNDYDKWINEIKEKRDPIAHQVPLYVPFRIIRNDDQLNEYKRMEKLANEKALAGDTHGYMEIMYKAKKIGEFIPKIMLVDSESETLSFIDFKNVINNDILTLNKIVKIVMEKLYN
jgi:hypothetical protein